MPNPLGRPSEYNNAIAEKICARIATGETPKKIAKDGSMPEETTIYKWLAKHDDFVQQYTLARERRADARSDRIDEYKEQVLQGKIAADVARIVIDTEKWQAGKENPKRYGDRTILAGDKDNPLQFIATRLDEAIARRAMIDVTPVHTAIEDNSDQI